MIYRAVRNVLIKQQSHVIFLKILSFRWRTKYEELCEKIEPFKVSFRVLHVCERFYCSCPCTIWHESALPVEAQYEERAWIRVAFKSCCFDLVKQNSRTFVKRIKLCECNLFVCFVLTRPFLTRISITTGSVRRIWSWEKCSSLSKQSSQRWGKTLEHCLVRCSHKL